jgi:hypothetical protein
MGGADGKVAYIGESIFTGLSWNISDLEQILRVLSVPKEFKR